MREICMSGSCSIAYAGFSASARRPPLLVIPSSSHGIHLLLDHLVGAHQHGRRHVEAERLCGLQVEHGLVPGRRLHRQVGRLLALEDAIDVAGCLLVLVDTIRPVGDQAAGGDEEAFVVDRGRRVTR